MSDSERDAWLREALRHAPDAGAAPPRDLSETILAQARAAARIGGAPARTAPRRSPVLALWDWLARPPVAAGFASVMAATLVGLMWWDRPIDETLPPRPAVTAARMPPSASADLGVATQQAAAERQSRAIVQDARGAATTTAPAAPPAANDDIAPLPKPHAQRRNEDPQRSDKLAANAAKAQPPANAIVSEAKEQERKLEAARDEKRADRAAAFPPGADHGALAKKIEPEAKDRKTSDRVIGETPADSLAMRDAPLAQSRPAAAAPAEAQRAEPPAAFARQRANEVAQASPQTSAAADAATRPPAAAPSRAMPAPAAAPAPPTQTAAAAAVAPPLRDPASASAELREKQASAFQSSRTAQAQREFAAAQREGAGATPLAPTLAAIAADPARWSRTTAAGGTVALDSGWRDWLAQLDAAARGRWQRSAAGADRQGDGATTLRLVEDGRSSVVVRLDGTTVHVEAIARGERWQATLPAGAAEQLRAAAERLGR
jgi:hypothetical protein